MKSPAALFTVVLIVCSMNLLVCPVSASAKKISEAEAVKIAEKFIAGQ